MNNKDYFKSYNYLSEADLQKLDVWTDTFPEEHPEQFKEILFKHGAEVSQEVECVVDTHRMRTSNQTHTGKRWVFVERIDKEHLRSGIATMEAYMASSDESTRKDMQQMSRRYKLPESKDVGGVE